MLGRPKSGPSMAMRNPYKLPYEKEKQLQRVRREVEVLRAIAPLLAEAADLPAPAGVRPEPRLIFLPKPVTPAPVRQTPAIGCLAAGGV